MKYISTTFKVYMTFCCGLMDLNMRDTQNSSIS